MFLWLLDLDPEFILVEVKNVVEHKNEQEKTIGQVNHVWIDLLISAKSTIMSH